VGLNVEIRPCRLEECPAVLRLWERADAVPSATDDVEVLERIVAGRPDCLLLAVQGKQIVGTVIAGWDGWRGHIYRLVVVPELRRQGLGRRLVSEAEERLRRLGVRRIALTVVGDDERAAPFWDAMAKDGYVRDWSAVRYTKNV
jgi:ribosomal protein S18 acetylase RimI-like enzyme